MQRRLFLQGTAASTVPLNLLPAGGVGLLLLTPPMPANAFIAAIPLVFGGIVALAHAIARAAEMTPEQRAQLAAERNWMPRAGEFPDSVHDAYQSNVVAAPASRFSVTASSAVVDMRDGNVNVHSLAARPAPGAKLDINEFEARCLGDAICPLTSRLEPNRQATIFLEQAWKAMGGEFGGDKGRYARLFTDAAGNQLVRTSIGRTPSGSALMVENLLR